VVAAAVAVVKPLFSKRLLYSNQRLLLFARQLAKLTILPAVLMPLCWT